MSCMIRAVFRTILQIPKTTCTSRINFLVLFQNAKYYCKLQKSHFKYGVNVFQSWNKKDFPIKTEQLYIYYIIINQFS